MACKTLAAVAKSESPKKIIVTARGISMSVGRGSDFANPIEYLLAGFAGCINIMGQLIAQEMGFTLKSLEIELEGDLDTAKSDGEKTEKRAGLIEIRARIKPEADADAQTLQKWLKALEDRSPVRDVFCGPTPVQIELAE